MSRIRLTTSTERQVLRVLRDSAVPHSLSELFRIIGIGNQKVREAVVNLVSQRAVQQTKDKKFEITKFGLELSSNRTPDNKQKGR